MILMLISIFVCSTAFAGVNSTVLARDKVSETVGWSVYAADDDMDTAGGLLTELDTTYAQLSAEEAVEVLSAQAGDITQTVTIVGIDNSGNKATESIALNTTNGTTAVTTTTVWRYIDQVSVDAECAGAITVRKATGDTLVISIPVGALEGMVSQHFNGEKTSYITNWRASMTSTTGTCLYELRFYPDDADCLDSGDGYKVLDQIAMTNVIGTDSRDYRDAIKCPAGGWIAVWQVAGSDNSDGSVTVQGYDI